MLFWGWLAYSAAYGGYVGCGIVGCERDRFIGIGVLYGMPLDSLCKFTFGWDCAYCTQFVKGYI